MKKEQTNANASPVCYSQSDEIRKVYLDDVACNTKKKIESSGFKSDFNK